MREVVCIPQKFNHLGNVFLSMDIISNIVKGMLTVLHYAGLYVF